MSASVIDLEVSKAQKEIQPSLTSPEMQNTAQLHDPNSALNISRSLQILTAQSKVDSKYDPPVPQAFQDYSAARTDLLTIIALLLFVCIIVYIMYVGGPTAKAVSNGLSFFRKRI
jgi:hypothetical protein